MRWAREDYLTTSARRRSPTSYQLAPAKSNQLWRRLPSIRAWLVDRFENDETYADLESFAHLQQVLDEQCYDYYWA